MVFFSCLGGVQEEFDEPTIEEEDMLEKLCESDGTVPRSFQKCRNSDTEDDTEDEQSNLDSHNDEAISDEETYNILS